MQQQKIQTLLDKSNSIIIKQPIKQMNSQFQSTLNPLQQKKRLTSLKHVRKQNPDKNTIDRIFNYNYPLKNNQQLNQKCKYQLGNLYIGGSSILSEQTFKKYQIRSLLSVLDHKQFQKNKISSKVQDSQHIIQHQWIDLQSNQDNILTYIQHSYDFIDDQLKSNMNLFVHSLNGLSRAPAIVIAYIVKKYGLKFQQAYTIVKDKRKNLQINDNLLEQIRKL